MRVAVVSGAAGGLPLPGSEAVRGAPRRERLVQGTHSARRAAQGWSEQINTRAPVRSGSRAAVHREYTLGLSQGYFACTGFAQAGVARLREHAGEGLLREALVRARLRRPTPRSPLHFWIQLKAGECSRRANYPKRS